MSSVRSKNSKAELLVFSYLRRSKIYHQKHYERAPGKPDIALPKKKKAIFIDGDYWHGRHMAKVTKNPFWLEKISKNKERDKKTVSQLKATGWRVLRVWESDINRKRTRDIHLNHIRRFLTQK